MEISKVKGYYIQIFEDLRKVLYKAAPQGSFEFESREGFKYHVDYQREEQSKMITGWEYIVAQWNIQIVITNVNEEGELVADGQSSNAYSRDDSSCHSSAASGRTGAGTCSVASVASVANSSSTC